MTISVKGIEGLMAQLREISAETGGKVLARAARKAFVPVLEAARAMVPVDSGALRDSLMIATNKPGEGDTVVAAGIAIGKGSGAKQAQVAAAAFGEGQLKGLPPSRRWHFIELGTSRQAPHPFLRPAIDQNAQRVVDELGKEVDKGIKRAIARKGGK
jgi:HK97 gp10 family phage protein